jgi:tryptophanyl-tRNA synthetase
MSNLTPNYGTDADEPLRPGQLTPNTIAKQFSQMELPGPENLRLGGEPSKAAHAARTSRDLTAELSTLDLPEPEALSKANAHRRSESQSQDLAEKFSRMNLPQPERIFGPDSTSPAGKQGVSADEWEKVQLPDDVPEAVKSPTLAHFRRESRAS